MMLLCLSCKPSIKCPAIYDSLKLHRALSEYSNKARGRLASTTGAQTPKAEIQLCGGPGNSGDLPGFTCPCLSYQSGMPLGWHSPREQETDYKPFNSRAWRNSSWGMAGLPYASKLYSLNRCSDPSKFTPVRQNHLLLLFPFFLLCFPLAPFHTPFCRKTFPKFKILREPGRGGAMGSKLQHVPSLSGHNCATPIPAEACSQPLHFSQSTNKACPTRNWAACSDLPQKCSFS